MSMPEILETDMTTEQKLLWSINSLWGNVNDIQKKVDKDHKILVEGNGELPLVEQVRNINSFVNGVKYWMKFLIGALLIQTMAFLGTAIVYLVKLAPIIEKLGKTP